MKVYNTGFGVFDKFFFLFYPVLFVSKCLRTFLRISQKCCGFFSRREL